MHELRAVGFTFYETYLYFGAYVIWAFTLDFPGGKEIFLILPLFPNHPTLPTSTDTFILWTTICVESKHPSALFNVHENYHAKCLRLCKKKKKGGGCLFASVWVCVSLTFQGPHFKAAHMALQPHALTLSQRKSCLLLVPPRFTPFWVGPAAHGMAVCRHFWQLGIQILLFQSVLL